MSSRRRQARHRQHGSGDQPAASLDSRRAPASRKSPRPRSGMSFLRWGSSLGLSVAFAVWVFRVRLTDVPYHYGYIQDGVLEVDRACIDAGLLWLACSGIGLLAGAMLGLAAPRRPSSRGVFSSAAVAASGLYLLAFRGGWGYDGLPATDLATLGKAVALPKSMPPIATAVPIALALAGSGVLLAAGLRATNTRSAGGSDKVNATEPGEDARGLPLMHLCLSLTAAHLTLQLPYYLGAREAFLHYLGDVAALLPGL